MLELISDPELESEFVLAHTKPGRAAAGVQVLARHVEAPSPFLVRDVHLLSTPLQKTEAPQTEEPAAVVSQQV